MIYLFTFATGVPFTPLCKSKRSKTTASPRKQFFPFHSKNHVTQSMADISFGKTDPCLRKKQANKV